MDDPTSRIPTPPADAGGYPSEPPSGVGFAALSTPSSPSSAPPGTTPPAQAGWSTPPPPPAPPAWQQPHRRDPREGRLASIVVGLFLLGLGLWFFAEHTLLLAMPVIRWARVWPVFIVAVGVLILVNAIRRERR